MTDQHRATDGHRDRDPKVYFESDDFSIEWDNRNGFMSDVRITEGAANYGRRKRLRNWLYHRAPWLPSWVTGWTTIRYRRPTKPFPSGNQP